MTDKFLNRKVAKYVVYPEWYWPKKKKQTTWSEPAESGKGLALHINAVHYDADGVCDEPEREG